MKTILSHIIKTLTITLLSLAIYIGLTAWNKPETIREWNMNYWNSKQDILQKKIELEKLEIEKEQMKIVRINHERR